MVGFGVTVAVIPAYFNAFRVFFQPFDILGKLFNEPLFRSFVISLSVNGFSRVETDKFNIFLQNFTPSKAAPAFIFLSSSVIFAKSFMRFFSQLFFHTQLYLLALADIFVPSI